MYCCTKAFIHIAPRHWLKLAGVFWRHDTVHKKWFLWKCVEKRSHAISEYRSLQYSQRRFLKAPLFQKRVYCADGLLKLFDFLWKDLLFSFPPDKSRPLRSYNFPLEINDEQKWSHNYPGVVNILEVIFKALLPPRLYRHE